MSTSYQLRKIGLPASVEKVKNLYRLTSSTTIIGRGQSVDIFLDSNIRKGLISRAHAQIIQTDGDNGEPIYSIFDTSLNGTYVNDVRVKGSVVLKEGDSVAFGHLCGSKISPGELGPQKETEFLFKFEKCLHEVKEEDLVDLTEKELNNNSSSVFMSPKSPLGENGSSLPGLNHVSLSSNLEPPEKKIKCSPTAGVGYENIDQKIYMDEEIDFKNVIDTATANIKSDWSGTNDDDSFLVDLDSKVSDVASEQVLSSVPVKLVHPRNKVIPIPLSNVNNPTDLIQLNGPNKSEKSKNKSEKALNGDSDDSDVEIESESESEYIDSDSGDSEKSEEIPDDSSDSEYVPRGKNSAKRKQSPLVMSPANLKAPRPNVVYNSPAQSSPKINTLGTTNRKMNDKSERTPTKKDNKKDIKKEEKKENTNGFTHDKCDAPRCKIPSGTLKTITWIQCDDCDDWYHVSCSGLSVAQAKREDTIFRCGCT